MVTAATGCKTSQSFLCLTTTTAATIFFWFGSLCLTLVSGLSSIQTWTHLTSKRCGPIGGVISSDSCLQKDLLGSSRASFKLTGRMTKSSKPLLGENGVRSCHNGSDVATDLSDKLNMEKYESLEPAIAAILAHEQQKSGINSDLIWRRIINEETYCFKHDWQEHFFALMSERKTADAGSSRNSMTDDSNILSMHELASLAGLCDQALFDVGHTALDKEGVSSKERVSIKSALPEFLQTLMLRIQSDNGKYCGAHTVIGTQLILGWLESEIRCLLSKQTGKSPLLKDMIESISELGSDETICMRASVEECRSLAKVLRSVLLPQGINLRNLLWHGFLGHLPRRWFALSVVMYNTVRSLGSSEVIMPKTKKSRNGSPERSPSEENGCGALYLRQHDTLKPILAYGEDIVREAKDLSKTPTKELMQSICLPKSYQDLLQVAFASYLDSPACLTAILSPMIEHTLRLIWCRVNELPQYAQAQVGDYYATLDGVGQRDRHPIVLLAYVDIDNEAATEDEKTNVSKNQLVYAIGGPLMALLGDMFASPCGGPNIRSALAHGLFDKELQDELCHAGEESPSLRRNAESVEEAPLRDWALCLVAMLHRLSLVQANNTQTYSSQASSAIEQYQPIFTHSASMVHTFDTVMIALTSINHHRSPSDTMTRSATETRFNVVVSSLIGDTRENSIEALTKLRNEFLSTFGILHTVKRGGGDADPWSAEDVFRDYDCGVALSKLGAALLLLEEIAKASNAYLALQKEYQTMLRCCSAEGGELLGRRSTQEKRRLKQLARVASLSGLVLDLYAFAVWMVFQEMLAGCSNDAGNTDGRLYYDGVRRSRMVISTFDAFLIRNTDRALKAVNDLMAAKVIKELLQAKKAQ
jgi:hypothetical protein